MDAKVIVTADKAGNVIVKSANNAEYGHIRVEQTRMLVDAYKKIMESNKQISEYSKYLNDLSKK